MPRRHLFRALAASLLLSSAALSSAATAPKVSLGSVDGLRQPLPIPYDEQANADKQVASARAQAKAQNKKLIIDLGGNWCPDCRVLMGVMELPEVQAFIRQHFVLVTVDIGRYDKNAQIAKPFGIAKLDGVPALLIVDPKTGKLVNKDHLFALADARHMTPQALADWLAQWA